MTVVHEQTPSTTTQARSFFRALHSAPRGFIMPNAWDAASAVILADSGFPAIATTSAGIAFSLGKPDYDVRWAKLAMTRDEMFVRVREITDAVNVPVSGDLESGYGDTPDDVAETITMAIRAGLAGANIEDKHPRQEGLYDESLAVERIAAARAAIDAERVPFVLTARTDTFFVSSDPAQSMRLAIHRSNLFRRAGADCLYAPGVADMGAVSTLVREIDGPLNVVTGLGSVRLSPRALIDGGVQRVSLGGAIARASLGFVRQCARELRERETIDFAAIQIAQPDLNALFADAHQSKR